MTSKNPCRSTMCSCRAHGLSCVGACGDCRGVDCLNVDATAMKDEEDEDF